MSSVPCQLLGTRWCTSKPRRRPHPVTRHLASRNRTARRTFHESARRALPDREDGTVVVDEHRCDRRVRAQLLHHGVGDRHPADLGRTVQRHRDLDARQRRQRRGILVVSRAGLTQREQRIRGALFEPHPWLTLRRGHLLGQMGDRLLELGAHLVGQLAPQVHEPLPPPHPQLPLREPRPGILGRRFLRPARQSFELHRIAVRRPPRPLPIRLLACDLHHRRQLLIGQATLHRNLRDRRQRLQRACRLDLVPHHPRRLARRSHRAVDLTPLVEHPQHRDLARPQIPLLHHQLAALASQPLRRVGPQLVDQRVEHALIQPRGYDTYRPMHSPPRTGRERPHRSFTGSLGTIRFPCECRT